MKRKGLLSSFFSFSFYPLILFYLLLLSLQSGFSAQKDDPVLPLPILQILNNEISGELAQDYIRDIARYHRLQPSRGYSQAAQWVAEKAKSFGLSDVQIERYPADGQTFYFMYPTSPAWDVEMAELWITKPQEEKLTSFAEIPVSVAINSHSCDVEAELIYVGEGTSPLDYEKVEVNGKVVLASGPIDSVANLAVDRFGALGVVTINMRFADDEPDNVSTLRLRTKTPTFGFGLSHRRGEALKARLLRGEKIFVRARVKAEISPYYYENVVATIPGTELRDEEILLTAHLCHYKPGANDNASGSACLLEIGRTLRRLIDEKKINPPKRTIRFLWVPEMSGSIAWVARHPEEIRRAVAGINLDMVGQYLNENNSTFFLHLTPHSRPHFINDLLINLVEFLAVHNMQAFGTPSLFPVYSLSGSRDAFRYRIMPYSGGSDQVIFNDGLIGVPFAFFLVWPDRYYHTSGDQPERCDPTQLKRSALLAAAATIFLSDDCPHQARRLAGEMAARSRIRLAEELKRGFNLLNSSETKDLALNYKEAINFIEQAIKREAAALDSLKNYSHRDKDIDSFLSISIDNLRIDKARWLAELDQFYRLTCEVRGIKPEKISLTPEEKAASKIIPKRNLELKGPVNLAYLREKIKDQPEAFNLPIFQEDSRITYEILNFVNGQNSLLDIRQAVSAEFKPIPLSWVQAYLELLARAGIVIF
jgi:aminopeptidase YwaD